jgi:hypothetical protein
MERNIANRVDRWLTAQPDVFYFNVHGNRYQKKGLPDRVGNVGPIAFYIELKRPGEEPSAIQRAIMRKICRTGGLCRTCRSLEEVQGFILKLRDLSLDINRTAGYTAACNGGTTGSMAAIR